MGGWVGGSLDSRSSFPHPGVLLLRCGFCLLLSPPPMEESREATDEEDMYCRIDGEGGGDGDDEGHDCDEVLASSCSFRRTRSQAAPEWSVNDSLVLVNEIGAVEGDCAKAFSSFQKWAMISENCTAFGVIRSPNQCRRRWEELLAEYDKIRVWNGDDSFWDMEAERRKGYGLPQSFDEKLFEAIHGVVKAQEERSDTEPDTDHPLRIAQDDEHHDDSGSRKPRHQVKSRVPASAKETQLTLTEKLRDSAEQIHTMLAGSFDAETRCEGSDINSIREQGGKLIAHLGDIVNNIEQLRDLIRGC